MSDLADVNDFNRQIIEEFRANDGKVGGPFDGAPMLVLHTTGQKSGKERLAPLVCRPEGEGWVIFASAAGADHDPDWCHNLRANPAASIEVGTETVPVTARILDPEEREPIWEAQKAAAPGFAEYEAKTTRTIPVIKLDRR